MTGVFRVGDACQYRPVQNSTIPYNSVRDSTRAVQSGDSTVHNGSNQYKIVQTSTTWVRISTIVGTTPRNRRHCVPDSVPAVASACGRSDVRGGPGLSSSRSRFVVRTCPGLSFGVISIDTSVRSVRERGVRRTDGPRPGLPANGASQGTPALARPADPGPLAPRRRHRFTSGCTGDSLLAWPSGVPTVGTVIEIFTIVFDY